MYLAVLLAALVLSPARSPLPDVAVSLPNSGIEVVDAADVDVASLTVGSRRAVRVASRNFAGLARPYESGWARVGRVSVHLVRVVRTNTVGPLGLFPDQVVWLVVIRDVTVPDLGPPRPGGRRVPFIGMLGVFVRTDTPRYVVATTF
jgi:hypothetical protein